MPRNKKLAVEVDIFYPHGKSPNDWNFIKTLRLEVNTESVDEDVEKVKEQIKSAIEEWK